MIILTIVIYILVALNFYKDWQISQYKNTLMALRTNLLTLIPHKYEPETTAGIGFCNICHSDDMNDSNHILDKENK